MSEKLNFVSDLALILISAGIITLIFKWLKQPLVLGYIVAGFLISPHFDFLPTVMETSNIKEWSEIGIIFLLFALGLDFSFKKLFKIGSTAFITAGVEIASMFCIGFITGFFLGWTIMESIFLGGMLAMSSTTIVIKAFEDMNLKNKKFTDIVLVVLIIQDLFAILLMVLLSTIAVQQHFSGMELLESLLKLAFFLILCFLIGIFVFPSFFRRFAKIMNSETLLIISIGLCFGMVSLANYVGFSSALGAFIMGSILSETLVGENIEKITKGIKDLFGAIFFVSVGMLVDPAILSTYWLPILILSLITIFIKSAVSTSGAVLAGQPLKVAIQSGASLAQIGEFAFIIASLGFTLGVMRADIYPIIVAVSVITTFTTPYSIRLAEPFHNWILPKLPASFTSWIEYYTTKTNTVANESDWEKLIKTYSTQIVIYTVLLIAIMICCFQYLYPFITEHFDYVSQHIIAIINTLITLLIMAPFLRGLMTNKKEITSIVSRLWNDNKLNRGALVGFVLLRIFIVMFFITSVLFKNFKFTYWVGLIFALGIVLFILLSRNSFRQFFKIKQHFISNLNEKEEIEKQSKPIRSSINKQFSQQDIHIENVNISSNSRFIGKTLSEMALRNKYGINIVKIKRGHTIINLPGGNDYIYPHDQILILGTDEQIRIFKEVVATSESLPDTSKQSKIDLTSFTLTADCPLTNKRICDISLRENELMIITIERNGEIILNPDPELTLKTNDLIWVVGNKKNLQHVLQKE